MTIDDAKAHIDEYGYAVLKEALTPDQANALRDRSVELITEERDAGGEHVYLDGCAQRVWNLVNKGRIYEEMIQLPQVLALQEYLLGDNCILSSFTVNFIGPGAPAGRLHIDFPLGSFPQPPPPFAFCANTIYVLDDFAPENGATHIVPGSYKRGYAPDPEKEYDDVIQLDVRKGDIVVFHGATWHGSGANHTEQDRMILLGFFCRSFMKPQQDQFKLARPEVVARATPTLKRLMGFESQSGMRT
ncbi:MAG: phytanoyl-CoA dioxygenase family protein [Gemmatimonadota bacterium]|nr:phytanoyl-CoA dioxygenase family protein [Gemmatimonadota bacterium]